jgi:hypothetical protein
VWTAFWLLGGEIIQTAAAAFGAKSPFKSRPRKNRRNQLTARRIQQCTPDTSDPRPTLRPFSQKKLWIAFSAMLCPRQGGGPLVHDGSQKENKVPSIPPAPKRHRFLTQSQP